MRSLQNVVGALAVRLPRKLIFPNQCPPLLGLLSGIADPSKRTSRLIRQKPIGVLLVEQNIDLIQKVATRA